MTKKPRRKPFPLVYARKAARVAAEMGVDLLISPQTGEFLLKTSKGTVTFDPVIDGRSISANFPHRRKDDSPPAEQAAEHVDA
jgi:hypothetical protein